MSNGIQANNTSISEIKLQLGELKGEQKSLSESIKTLDKKYEDYFTKILQSRKDFDKEIRDLVSQNQKDFGQVKEIFHQALLLFLPSQQVLKVEAKKE